MELTTQSMDRMLEAMLKQSLLQAKNEGTSQEESRQGKKGQGKKGQGKKGQEGPIQEAA